MKLFTIFLMVMFIMTASFAAQQPLDDTSGQAAKGRPYVPIYIMGSIGGTTDRTGVQVQPMSTEVTWPTAAPTSSYIASTATADTGLVVSGVSTGARTVFIWGVDSSYAYLSETVYMDGNTVETLTNDYYRINGMKVVTAGSGGVAAGTIYIANDPTSWTTGSPYPYTTILCCIKAGQNASRQMLQTVPASMNEHKIVGVRINSTYDYYARTLGTVEAECKWDLYVKPYGGVKYRFPIATTDLNSQNPVIQLPLPIDIYPKSDYWVVITKTQPTEVGRSFGTTAECVLMVEEY